MHVPPIPWNMLDMDSSGSVVTEEYPGHPDPSWARRQWTSLDGEWDIEHRGAKARIRVPFPIGSEASGIDFRDKGRFEYSRSFELPDDIAGSRFVLHVGACDYESTVFVNGGRVGRHVGGYASFEFDITAFVRGGDNTIRMAVRDSHSAAQARGKQTFLRKPFYVWYGGVAGVWQSVWIERSGEAYLGRAIVKSDFGAHNVSLAVPLCGASAGTMPGNEPCLRIVVTAPDGGIRSFDGQYSASDRSFSCTFPFDDAGVRLWSPEHPDLYGLALTLSRGGETLDEVDSYFGLRDLEAKGGRIRINGEPLYLRMALVQGYYPGGVYTPLERDRMRDDILALKGMGFNGARIHEKIESPYFHYLCDRIGLLTTFEMPSFYRPTRGAFTAYEGELREIIARDSGHPSCIAWILFNETWGVWGMYRRNSATRHFMKKMLDLVRTSDPGRPVIENSGWEHFDTDIVDFHHYLKTSELAASFYRRLKAADGGAMHGFSAAKVLKFYLADGVGNTTRAIFLDEDAERRAGARNLPWFLSEYGGFGWYSSADEGSVADKIERYTRDILDSGLFCGYCLTQLYDVDGETNGLLSFDRRPKVDAARMKAINRMLPPS